MKHQDLDRRDPREQDTYQTGSTRPPKSHNGLITLLLIIVIFLAGIVSILSILNIRLFSALTAKHDRSVPMALYADDQTNEASENPDTQTGQTENDLCLGISGEPVSMLCQNYYNLPSGLYITRIDAGSIAQAAGLEAGDILISLNSIVVTGNEELRAVLNNCGCSSAEAVIYRDRRVFTVTLTLEQTNE